MLLLQVQFALLESLLSDKQINTAKVQYKSYLFYSSFILF